MSEIEEVCINLGQGVESLVDCSLVLQKWRSNETQNVNEVLTNIQPHLEIVEKTFEKAEKIVTGK